MRPTLFRLASDNMDDDSALTQILEANDELTLAVNIFKEQLGRSSGRDRSRSEEETDVKSNGTVAPDDTSTSWFVPLCSAYDGLVPPLPAAPTSPREIKSYHLIDFSALESPETHRKADSPAPVFPPPMENDLDFNGLGCSTFTRCFS